MNVFFYVAIIALIFMVIFVIIKRKRKIERKDFEEWQKRKREEEENRKEEISLSPEVIELSIPEPSEGNGSIDWGTVEGSSKKEVMKVFKGLPFGVLSCELDEFYFRETKKILIQERGLPIMTIDQLKKFLADEKNWHEIYYCNLLKKKKASSSMGLRKIKRG